MKKAYYSMLCEELYKENKLPIFNLLKEIGERLLLIIPEKRKESFKNKFQEENLTNLLINNYWNDNIIKFIDFIIDTILLLSAPIDDEINNKWKQNIQNLYEKDYIYELPNILIMIEEKIDRIYELIINFNENNK